METNKGAIKQELITGRQTAGTIGIHFKINRKTNSRNNRNTLQNKSPQTQNGNRNIMEVHISEFSSCGVI